MVSHKSKVKLFKVDGVGDMYEFSGIELTARELPDPTELAIAQDIMNGNYLLEHDTPLQFANWCGFSQYMNIYKLNDGSYVLFTVDLDNSMTNVDVLDATLIVAANLDDLVISAKDLLDPPKLNKSTHPYDMNVFLMD